MSSLTVLRDAVQEAYGLPCDDFDPECAGCRAWKALFVTREQFERLRAENARMKDLERECSRRKDELARIVKFLEGGSPRTALENAKDALRSMD